VYEVSKGQGALFYDSLFFTLEIRKTSRGKIKVEEKGKRGKRRQKE
jgi:hypothetical protein